MSMTMVDLRNNLVNAIALDMQSTANSLASGRAQDYAAYREGVGKITGGRQAMNIVEDTFKKLLDEGDEE